MNDPNGLVFLDGEYHLFYQHNPEGNKSGRFSRGHAVSRDLLRWEHLPLAMREEDGMMIFSGSAVVDASNTSGSVRSRGSVLPRRHLHGTHEEEANAEPVLRPETAGVHGPSTAGNPVLDLSRGDHRDPKVFWYEPVEALDHGQRACGRAKGAAVLLARSQAMGDAERLRTRRGPPAASGNVPTSSRFQWTAIRRTCGGCSTLTSTRADRPAARARSISSGRSTGRGSSTRTPPAQNTPLGGLRQGLLRDPVC